MGRLALLLKAAGMKAPTDEVPPEPPQPGSDAAKVEEEDGE
jgi:hypothetical protein